MFFTGILYCILSFNTLLGLKASASLGGTSLRFLVIGLTTTRSNFFFTSKLPKPGTFRLFSSSRFSERALANAPDVACSSYWELAMRLDAAVRLSLLFIYIILYQSSIVA